MAQQNVKLPDVGEGVTEGELVRWLVKVGDTVKADQPVVELMTDKATVEVPSPFAGTVKELKYRNPYQASLDGNTVEMPVEQVKDVYVSVDLCNATYGRLQINTDGSVFVA